MRRTAILSIIALLALAWARSGRAQSTSIAADSGTHLRVTGCLPVCGDRFEGELLWADYDSLALAGKTHVTTVALRDVRRLEVGTRYRFDGRRALIWGVAAALVTTLMGVADEWATGGEVLGAAAVWGGGAAVFAGGGKKALRAGMVGGLITAPLMGALFVATEEPCSGGWFCLADSEEALFAWGALAGGITGFVIGGAIGAFTGGEEWQEIPLNGVNVSVAPTRDGLALRASLPFRVP
jgi:hypothetical protein